MNRPGFPQLDRCLGRH